MKEFQWEEVIHVDGLSVQSISVDLKCDLNYWGSVCTNHFLVGYITLHASRNFCDILLLLLIVRQAPFLWVPVTVFAFFPYCEQCMPFMFVQQASPILMTVGNTVADATCTGSVLPQIAYN